MKKELTESATSTAADNTQKRTQKTAQENDNKMKSAESQVNKIGSSKQRQQQQHQQQQQQKPFEIYKCKYSYDPAASSPNENPDSELALTAGEFLLIYGNMDEDGFYEGETMTGLRGLVPSNYIEKVSDKGLLELYINIQTNNKTAVNRPNQPIVSVVTKNKGISAEVKPIKQETGHEQVIYPALVVEDSNKEETVKPLSLGSTDLSGVCLSQLQDTDTSEIPAPKFLRLERQLHNSLCIAWSPPDGLNLSEIICYNIYCDGLLVATSKPTDRTKALLENVESTRNHQICVRTVTKDGQSSDRASVIHVGQGGRLLPAALRVSDVTSTSAVIVWTPASNAVEHIVTIDEQQSTTIAEGVHKCLITDEQQRINIAKEVHKCPITGLKPYSHHTVTVSSVSHPTSKNDESAVLVSFCTLLKDLPKAPQDVQVDVGPQRGTLLVTWVPVSTVTTVDGQVTDLVSGYSVYLDGRRVKELSSPTDDHVILGCESFSISDDPRQITVRALTAFRESRDSQSATLTSQLQQELACQEMAINSEKLSSRQQGSAKKDGEIRIGRVLNNPLTSSENFMIESKKEEISKANQQNSNSATGDSKSTKLGGSINLPKKQEGNGKRDYFNSEPEGNKNPAQNVRNLKQIPAKKPEVMGLDLDAESVLESSEVEDNTHRRIFVGIYDYVPSTMSPNPDAAKKELQFSEGQLLKVIGDKDSDGFYLAESNGRRGLVPCNLVSEVKVDDPILADLLLEDAQKSNKLKAGRSWRQAEGSRRLRGMATARQVVALYDYNPRHLSPNVDAEAELTFYAGDLITVYGEIDDDGFFQGEMGGVFGLVPSNFVKPLHPQKRAQGGSTRQTGRSQSLRRSPSARNRTPSRNRSPSVRRSPAGRAKSTSRARSPNKSRSPGHNAGRQSRSLNRENLDKYQRSAASPNRVRSTSRNRSPAKRSTAENQRFDPRERHRGDLLSPPAYHTLPRMQQMTNEPEFDRSSKNMKPENRRDMEGNLNKITLENPDYLDQRMSNKIMTAGTAGRNMVSQNKGASLDRRRQM